ncbi:hypothetical protein BH18ACT4_BH18ACT4_09270 [soil metagenome]
MTAHGHHRGGPVGCFGDHLDVGFGLEDHSEAGPHELLVVGQHDTDGHGFGSGNRARTS